MEKGVKGAGVELVGGHTGLEELIKLNDILREAGNGVLRQQGVVAPTERASRLVLEGVD